MNIEAFREYCLAKPGVTESFPFDAETLVFKVGGKMFALIGLEHAHEANLKCDPERALQLRMDWEEIRPGYHMSKLHWNTVSFTGRLSHSLILELIDHSYELVFANLPKKLKLEIQGLV